MSTRKFTRNEKTQDMRFDTALRKMSSSYDPKKDNHKEPLPPRNIHKIMVK